MDSKKIVDAFISSEGDIPLTVERLNRQNPDEVRVTEYEVIAAISEDENAVFKKLRNLVTLKLFTTIMSGQFALLSAMEDLPAKELVKAMAQFTAVFAQMTAPSTKDTFDFELEVERAANELGVSADEVRADLKKSLNRNKV